MMTKLSRHWNTIQATLFPLLEEELCPMTKLQERLVRVLDFVRVEEFLPYYHGLVGAPSFPGVTGRLFQKNRNIEIVEKVNNSCPT